MDVCRALALAPGDAAIMKEQQLLKQRIAAYEKKSRNVASGEFVRLIQFVLMFVQEC